MEGELPATGRGSEAVVQAAFERWLTAEGWVIRHEPRSWIDVIAERGTDKIIAEVKGRTGSSAGLDVDTMYGQLLRRMTPGRAGAKWAVVVPSSAVRAVLRVDEIVRRSLGILVFEVRDDGSVVEHG